MSNYRRGRGRHRHGRRMAYRPAGYRRPKHNVPVNLLEYEDRFEAHVFALGFPKENIAITVSDDVMYIAGTRQPSDEHPPFMLQEYPIKSFERSFELSERADQEQITAKMVDGVVIITILKTKAAQRPDVEVSIA
ncbi:MAG: Hsp20/alpha crystallin family protein [Bacteroidota bacterium]